MAGITLSFRRLKSWRNELGGAVKSSGREMNPTTAERKIRPGKTVYDCFKRRLSRSRCRPACFQGELTRSRFFAPAASLPLPCHSGVLESRAAECPQEEKAGQKQSVRDPPALKFRGSPPKSKKAQRRPRLGASKRPDKEWGLRLGASLGHRTIRVAGAVRPRCSSPATPGEPAPPFSWIRTSPYHSR